MISSNKTKPILGTLCPSGHLNDPAIKKAYKGCSIYSYKDSKKKKQLVMLDQDFYVKYGTQEAMGCRHKTNLEMRYNLRFEKKVGE